MIEHVIQQRNLNNAYQQVLANKGAGGVDGMEIPKPNGKTRMLGIPTLTDRVIQQALHQALEPVFEPGFQRHSYGFRPNRNAHQAVQQAQRNINEGYQHVIDIDLKSFFDQVDHAKLLELVHRKVRCRLTMKLLRKFLRAPMQIDGKLHKRREGVPQGSPLSPLLSNILLNKLDRELEKRGHRYVRYADDCAPGNVPARWGNRPPAAGLRRQAANHRERLRSRAEVVSVTEKAEQNSVRYETEKTNESEPLMKRRKRRDVVITGRQSLARDKLRGKSAYCCSGDRRKGGVRPFRACRCNPGTCRLDAKGAAQAADLQGPEYRSEAQGRISP